MHDIYDRTFKKILTLSSRSVINLINGLFETDYPLDSELFYNWTEFVDGDLKKTLADTIITINNQRSYHLEAQMTEDETIVFRVFDYSYHFAERGNFSNTLVFPEPKIIYLCPAYTAPDTEELTLDFGTQGTFTYRVNTFKFLDTPVEELDRRKLIILIPFYILRLKNVINSAKHDEVAALLHSTLFDDIINSVETNYRCQNITKADRDTLLKLTMFLMRHIAAGKGYEKEIDAMDESILFDFEIQEKINKAKIEELEEKIDKQYSMLSERDMIIEKQAMNLQKQNSIIEKQAQELATLKAELEKLRK